MRLAWSALLEEPFSPSQIASPGCCDRRVLHSGRCRGSPRGAFARGFGAQPGARRGDTGGRVGDLARQICAFHGQELGVRSGRGTRPSPAALRASASPAARARQCGRCAAGRFVPVSVVGLDRVRVASETLAHRVTGAVDRLYSYQYSPCVSKDEPSVLARPPPCALTS